jgi:hypothetical protein
MAPQKPKPGNPGTFTGFFEIARVVSGRYNTCEKRRHSRNSRGQLREFFLIMKIQQIWALGDTHNRFRTLQIIKENYKKGFLKPGDTIFHLGDNGMMDFHPLKLDSYYRKCVRLMEELELSLHIIRGNHDDPSFYKDYKNTSDKVTICRDHMLMEIDEVTFRCVGGAASIDREYRYVGKDWFFEEMPTEADGPDTPNPCDVVIAHALPGRVRRHFDPLIPRSDFVNKLLNSPVVQLDVLREGEVLETSWKKYQPKLWVCGHYHINLTETFTTGNISTKFCVVDIDQMVNITELLQK